MGVKWVDLADVPMIGNRYGQLQDELNMLVNSSRDAFEADVSRYKSINVAQNSYTLAIKRGGYWTDLRAIIRGGRLFVVKRKEAEHA